LASSMSGPGFKEKLVPEACQVLRDVHAMAMVCVLESDFHTYQHYFVNYCHIDDNDNDEHDHHSDTHLHNF